jgi:hypothetical protein
MFFASARDTRNSRRKKEIVAPSKKFRLEGTMGALLGEFIVVYAAILIAELTLVWLRRLWTRRE